MRAADGERHGIGEQGTGSVDETVARTAVVCLVVVDVRGEDGLQPMAAVAVVGFYDVEEVAEASLAAPCLVVAEIDILACDVL